MWRRWVFVSLVVFSLGLFGVGGLLLDTGENAPTTPTTASHALALAAEGDLLLVANPDSNSLTFLDTASQTVLAEIALGQEPRAIAVNGDRAYVANRGADTVSVVNVETRAVVATVSVGTQPVSLAVSPDGRFLAVAEQGDDTVRFLDTTTLVILSIQAVPDRPHGLAFTPAGRDLLVSHLLSGTVTRLPVQPHHIHLPLVQSQNADTELPHESATEPSALFRTPHSPIPHSTIPTWPHVAPAPAVVVNAAGTRAYLPQTMANGLGLNVQFDNTVFPKVSVLNLETWSHQTSEHISLPETDRPVGLPWDVALARDDGELWVVNGASNDVSVIDISNPAVPVRRAHIPVGANPRGVAISPDGSMAYVNNTLDGTVSVIDAAAYTVTAVIPVTDIPLPPLLLEGKRLFHSSARPGLAQAAWISCNTCHVEGEHDGRTWLLQYVGEIPPGGTPVITRNTTSLLGMIETYPLRWSAEWDESADSEFSIRFEQFGTGLIDGDMHPTLGPSNQGRSKDLDALAAFIDSLSVPGRAHILTPTEQRGQAIFESPQTQCAACHPAPLYTDLQQHDVGTADAAGEWFGPAIDTPTLRFLYDSTPYLHDGNAPTLLDVLTVANPNDAHGVTSHLSDQELADLVAFLLALPHDE